MFLLHLQFTVTFLQPLYACIENVLFYSLQLRQNESYLHKKSQKKCPKNNSSNFFLETYKFQFSEEEFDSDGLTAVFSEIFVFLFWENSYIWNVRFRQMIGVCNRHNATENLQNRPFWRFFCGCNESARLLLWMLPFILAVSMGFCEMQAHNSTSKNTQKWVVTSFCVAIKWRT